MTSEDMARIEAQARQMRANVLKQMFRGLFRRPARPTAAPRPA